MAMMKHTFFLFMIGSLLTATTFSLCSTSINTPKDDAASDYHARQGWQLVWSDEFEGAALDRSKWTPETSCWGGGNNERQCYTNRGENIAVQNGVLKLIAKPEKFIAHAFAQDRSERGAQVTQNFTSGKIRVKDTHSWKYGRFEARLKLPQGQSVWPAFWMLPTENSYGGWPLSGEIDIMEAVNLGTVCKDCEASKTENRSSIALHYGGRWPDNDFETHKVKLPNATDTYHIFALEWGQGRMDWFVDNQKVYSAAQETWHTAAVDKKVNPLAPFDKRFNLILNLAVGGNLPDNKNENRFNPNSFAAELLVDWVRVYQCAGDTETSGKCMSLD